MIKTIKIIRLIEIIEIIKIIKIIENDQDNNHYYQHCTSDSLCVFMCFCLSADQENCKYKSSSGRTIRVHTTMTHHPPPPPPGTQDFDQTLNVASWEHLEQIPTVTGTFVQATSVQATFVHITNISAVTDSILTRL